MVVGPRAALAAHTVPLTDAVLHRDAARVDRVKLRYRSEPVPLPGRPGAGAPRSRSSSHEPALGVAPGQTACLMDGDRVVGHGTIAA